MSDDVFRRSGGAQRALRAVTGSVIARFASVGVVNTLVDLGLYVALFSVGLSSVLANFLSTSAGMAVSFAGNRRFVFGATANRTREITQFLIVCGLGIWVIQPFAIMVFTHLINHVAGLPTVVVATTAKVLAILVAAVWNYLLYSRLVFRTAERPTTRSISE